MENVGPFQIIPAQIAKSSGLQSSQSVSEKARQQPSGQLRGPGVGPLPNEMMATPNVIVALRQMARRRDKVFDVRIYLLHHGDNTARDGFVVE